MAVDICYVISHGFSERMILHSGVIPQLRARGLSVALVTSNANEPPVRRFAETHDVSVYAPPPMGKPKHALFGNLRPYIYENVLKNPALLARHQRTVAGMRFPRRYLQKFYLLLNQLIVLFSLRSLFVARERRLLDNPQVHTFLKELQPSLVVSTYPVNALETTMILEAQKLNIPTAGELLSWDNITAKGRFTGIPEYYLAWGPIMREELQVYYDVPHDHIYETGVPHFDMHLSAVDNGRRREELERLGLDADRPYIFLGMSAPVFAPREVEIVEWLARQVEADRFGETMQFIVRPHPQNIQGSMADQKWLPRLDAIRSERVAVDYPVLNQSQLAWSMDESDLPKLVNLLAGCAMSLNSGSTLSIDTIVQDKPVIITRFDADDRLPWWQSSRKNMDFIHLRKLAALGGLRVVESFDELAAAIDAYLADPSRDAAGRQRSREQELGACDGNANERVADALVSILDHIGATAPAVN